MYCHSVLPFAMLLVFDWHIFLNLSVRRCFSEVLCLHRKEWMEVEPADFSGTHSFFSPLCVCLQCALPMCARACSQILCGQVSLVEGTLKGEASREKHLGVTYYQTGCPSGNRRRDELKDYLSCANQTKGKSYINPFWVHDICIE